MKNRLLALLLTSVASLAHADKVTQTVSYSIDGAAYEGVLVYDSSNAQPRPGLLMVPNWMGVTEAAVEKAWRVAGSDYVVFIADMYGAGIRPADADEAGKLASQVRNDRSLQRQRVNAALSVLREQDHPGLPLDASQIAAIGFCFGGGSVLELARSGTELAAVISFHGNLDTPDPADAENIRTSVLVLHGADDPYVPTEQVQAFEQEMRQAGVDWQLTSYGGAVHSFTDPYADMPGQADYHPQVAARAFAAMRLFLDEQLAD